MANEEKIGVTEKIRREVRYGRARRRASAAIRGLGNRARLRELADSARTKELGRFLAMPVPAMLAGGVAASLAGPFLATRVADGVLSHQTRSFDHTVLDMARGARHSSFGNFGKRPLDPLMTVLSAAGEPRTLYPLTALVAAKWVADERTDDAATLVLGLVGSASVGGALKRIVHRPRPFFKLPLPRSRPSGSSFPSDHANMSLATYGILAFLLARRRNAKDKGPKAKGQGRQVKQHATAAIDRRTALGTWAPALLFCGLIGWSRIYQGVHNPSDVLGGWLTGGIWLVTCTTVASAVTQPRS